LRKHFKFTILALIALVILWFFGRSLNWEEVSRSLRKANAVYLTIAVLIICLGYLLRAVRWKALLKPITETSLKELFATTTVGFGAMFLVGRMGEIVRPMWLPMRDKRVRPSAALVTIGVERIFDLGALIVFFAANFLWFETPVGRENEFAYVKLIGFAMLGGVLISFVALAFYQRMSAGLIGFIQRQDSKFFPARIKQVVTSILTQLGRSLHIFHNGREVAVVIFWTLLLWFAIAIPTWLVMLAFDLPFGFSASLFVMGWAAIGSVVPTPGGAAGAFHAATAAGLIFLGTDTDQAAAVSIAMHLVYFAPAVFFGLYYFIHGDISIERLRSLISSEHTVEEVEHELDNVNGATIGGTENSSSKGIDDANSPSAPVMTGEIKNSKSEI